MNLQQKLVLTALLGPAAALAQLPDMAALQKWEAVKVVRYEVVGEIAVKHARIPSIDADLYADITDRVRLTFDWDVQKGVIIGTPKIVNEPGTAANFESIGKGCPTGKMNGPYEHFDIVAVKQARPGEALALVGERKHPESQVAEACSKSLRTVKAATVAVTEHIMPPDPKMLVLAPMAKVSTIKLSPDGKSVVMSALNDKWIWTFTPTAK